MEHGYKSILYTKWQGAKRRSAHPEQFGYNYSISICEEWMNYEGFKEWALNNGYEKGLTLDRIDNSIGYNPSNCRWVTHKVQARNTSRNKYLEYNNEIKTLAEWCEILGLHYGSTASRLTRGWSIERAFEETVSEAKKNAVKYRKRDTEGRYINE
jgi:hypothetical protein